MVMKLDFQVMVIDSAAATPIQGATVSFTDFRDSKYYSAKFPRKELTTGNNGMASWEHFMRFGASSQETALLSELPTEMSDRLAIGWFLIEAEAEGYFAGRDFVIQKKGDPTTLKSTLHLEKRGEIGDSHEWH